VAGALLVVAAASLSGEAIERALLGEAWGRLAWGPSLFRALLALHGAGLIAFGLLPTRRPTARPGGAGWQPIGPVAWGALSALTAIALVLRLWSLNSGLWFDEVLTLLDFARPSAGVILTSFPSQNQHMLYSLLAHACLTLFGESAWALRLPAVVFGIGSIWALFFLGRRLLGTTPALLACALMTASYHHIWFSQNARGYTGLLFSATLATWLWLEALDRQAWPWWIAYALALWVGFAVHVTTAFVAASHALVYLALRVNPRLGARPGHTANPETEAGWKPLAAWTLCGTLTLQLYALALPEFLRSAVHEVSLPSEWLNPLWVVREFGRALTMAWFGPVALVLGVAFIGAGYLSIARRDWRAALIMVLPAVLGGGSMLALAHNLWPRFFFFSMGFGLLVVIAGAFTAARVFGAARARPMGVAFASLMILASAATVPRCYSLPKQDFAGAREFVNRARGSGDPVVAVGLAGRAYHEYFAPRWPAPQNEAELAASLKSAARAWLVYTLPIELEAYHPEIWRVVESDFEVVRVFHGTLGGGEVYVCRERAAATEARARLVSNP
jgi:hypothetical protein